MKKKLKYMHKDGDVMKNVSILPVDSYVVVNKSIINDNDRKILTMLYQPIIGGIAINLYFSLWADLNKQEVMGREYTHHHLMTITKLSLEDIVVARKKLEALGLLRTYYKYGEVNNYVYELYSPISASEFLSNPILSVSLYSFLGDKEYEYITNYYKIPKINLTSFENISTKFSDIYNLDIKKINDVTQKNIQSKEKLDLIINETVDFDFIIRSTKGLLNEKSLTNNMKKLINNLCYLYNFDEVTISNIIKNSLNEKGIISDIELKKNCKNYYSFENKGKIPNLVYKKRNTVASDNIIDGNLREKLIKCFESKTPYEFLKSKYKGAKPTNKDITLLETLLTDQELNPGVINVLIDYVIRINDSKLNKNLIESIASQWKMLGIETVSDAMKQAEIEYKKHKNYIQSKNEKEMKFNPQVKLPHWYGKDIKKEDMTIEEELELKNMLKEFK